jgi:hypothetical protein
MFVLVAFKGHSAPEIISVICAMNTDHVVIPGGMTSQLQVLLNKQKQKRKMKRM